LSKIPEIKETIFVDAFSGILLKIEMPVPRSFIPIPNFDNKPILLPFNFSLLLSTFFEIFPTVAFTKFFNKFVCDFNSIITCFFQDKISFQRVHSA
jgi:hypothetical protein